MQRINRFSSQKKLFKLKIRLNNFVRVTIGGERKRFVQFIRKIKQEKKNLKFI